MTNQLVDSSQDEVAFSLVRFNEGLIQYLCDNGLPSEGVLAVLDERKIIVQNMPTIINQLTADQRNGATYISKFTAAIAVGLFDAALNYLWNETIRNLRNKVSKFDLPYFFDTAIKEPTTRSKFVSEDDLTKLSDWEFINGCREIGLISELGFKHLDFIRDMRNYASAAHPNQSHLTGFQLVQWMDTCIKEVLAKEPSSMAVETKRLLRSLREEELDRGTAAPVNLALSGLDPAYLLPILRTVFGMYVDPDLSAHARENIRLVRETLWDGCSEEARYEFGLKFASYSANGETDRAALAREFLDSMAGLRYLPKDSLALELSGALDSLMAAHNGPNNFYNESYPAATLEKLVPESGVIPDNIRSRYVKCITLCKMTNGYGVAWNAEPIYDRTINTWQTAEILTFLFVTSDSELQSRLRFSLCNEKLHEIATSLIGRASNTPAYRGLKLIASFDPESAGKSINTTSFKNLVSKIKGLGDGKS